MSREVADSDDESEVITSAPSRSVSLLQDPQHPVEQPPPSTLERDPLTGVNFDDYLSPTQRLSSAVAADERALTRTVNTTQDGADVNSSTERFLDEIAPRSSPVLLPSENAQEFLSSSAAIAGMGSLKKRSHLQMSDLSSGDMAKRKRRKSQDPSNADRLEIDARADQYAHSGMISADIDPSAITSHDTSTTEPLGLTFFNSAGHLNSTTSVSRVPFQPYAPHSNYFANSVSYGMPAMSSVGGHQSLNINPSSLGMDFGEINPFGRLSQISTTEDADPELDQTRGIAEIFRNAAANSGRVTATKIEEAGVRNGKSGSVKNRTTAPVQHLKTDPAVVSKDLARASTPERTNLRQSSESSPAFSPLSNRAGSTDAPIPAEANTIKHAKPAPKKRGRKPKNKQKTDEPVVVSDDNIDELQMDEHQQLRQVRANTVDSVSNVSEASVASTGSKKRKRGVKKGMVEPEVKVQLKKLPSSDLGLNDKAVIGLSPERYKPRPSKRRGRNVEPEMDIEREVKLIEAAHQKRDKQSNADVAEPVEDAKTTRKRGRKAKIKNTDQMDQDKVVADLETEADREGSPEDGGPAQTLEKHEDQDEQGEDVLPKVTNVTINIPPLPKPGGDAEDGSTESAPVAPEPKKRGRKRKQKLSVAQEEEIIEVPGEHGDQAETKIEQEPTDGSTRPALAEKDLNTSLSNVENGGTINPPDEDADTENPAIAKPNNIKHESNQKVESPAPAVETTSTAAANTPSNPLFSSPYRIGLSRRRPIPSLLRKVDRNKELPKAIERKEKLTAAQQREREKEELERQEALENGEEYTSKDNLRDADGRLVEWDF